MNIRWCKTCLEPNTRPKTQFSEDGVCMGCQNVSKQAAEKIDWSARKATLKEIVQWGKDHSATGYDCLIGVSGGKDSTRQALFAREIGLTPLLVSCIYPPEQQTDRGVRNLANLISLGFDAITVAPAPGTSKKLMRNCFEAYGNLFNATELALYGSLPITAIAYNIPLIMFGENAALSYGGNVGSMDHGGNRMKYMDTLKGGDPRKFAPKEVTDEQLYWYRYPQDEEIDRANLRIVFMGYFLPDFNDHTNSRISIENGLEVRTGRDGDPANMGGIAPYTALDDDFVIVNQMLRYLKFGLGKATQEVSSAIRFGLMRRDEGVELVKQYDGKCADFYLEKLCDYLEISRAEFWQIADRFVNRDLFEKDTHGNWKPKFTIQ